MPDSFCKSVATIKSARYTYNMQNIFNLTVTPAHGEIESVYNSAMERLNAFFGIDWTEHVPSVFFVEDRATIDFLRKEKTEPWVVGWADHNKVFLLSIEKMKSEADREYSVDEYNALLAHELCHLFFRVSTGGNRMPVWLNEGLSDYISGNIRFKKRPDRFSSFLEFFNSGGAGVYEEASFAVETLVDAYGKEKLLALLRKIKEAGQNMTREQFEEMFKTVYGLELSYDTFNKIAGS